MLIKFVQRSVVEIEQ